MKNCFIFYLLISTFALLAGVPSPAQNSVRPAPHSATAEGSGRNVDASLPDAPSSSVEEAGHAQSQIDEKGSVGQGGATISGTVLDSTGAAVAGATVSLVHTDGPPRQTLMSGANGESNFIKISPGSCLVTVEAPGFRPFTSTEIVVTGPEVLDLPPTSLMVGTATTDVVVHPTAT